MTLTKWRNLLCFTVNRSYSNGEHVVPNFDHAGTSDVLSCDKIFIRMKLKELEYCMYSSLFMYKLFLYCMYSSLFMYKLFIGK